MIINPWSKHYKYLELIIMKKKSSHLIICFNDIDLLCYLSLTPDPKVFWLGTFLNPPVHFWKHALIFKMHYAFSLIFHIQHLLPVLLEGSNFAPFEVPVSNSADFGVVRVKVISN